MQIKQNLVNAGAVLAMSILCCACRSEHGVPVDPTHVNSVASAGLNFASLPEALAEIYACTTPSQKSIMVQSATPVIMNFQNGFFVKVANTAGMRGGLQALIDAIVQQLNKYSCTPFDAANAVAYTKGQASLTNDGRRIMFATPAAAGAYAATQMTLLAPKLAAAIPTSARTSKK